MVIYLLVIGLLLGAALLSVAGRGDLVAVSTPDTGGVLLSPAVEEDFGEELRRVSAGYPGRHGVIVYDIRTESSYSFNEDGEFVAASLAKLPVLMALYRDASSGRLSLNEEISIEYSDIQTYGSGKLQTYPVGYTMTLRDCAGVMINDSDNTAWVMLERRLGKQRIAGELRHLGLSGTDYYTLTTTPEDVLAMLRAISDPDYTSPELSEEMLAAMTDTDFEGRLPAALPDDVRVAHKVGSLDDTFSDAGIVFDKSGTEPDYFVVAVTQTTNESLAASYIRKISASAYEDL